MSQFEQGRRSFLQRPNDAPPAPSLGIVESPEVLPPIALPPIPEQQDLTIAALQAFGLTGQAVALTGEYQERQRQRKAAEDAELEQFHRGFGARKAAEDAPRLLDEIRQGRLVAPNGTRYEDFLGEFLNGRYSDQEVYFRDEYRRRLLPTLTAAMFEREDDIRKRAREEATQDLKDQAIGLTDPEGIRAAMRAGVDQAGLTEQQSMEIALAAAESAADRGDQAAWDAANTVLGSSFELERAKLANTLRARLGQREAAEREGALDEIGNLWIKSADPASGVTIDSVGKRIIELRDAGALDGSTAASAYENFLNRKEQAVRAVQKQSVEVERQGFEQSVIASGLAATLNARDGLAGRAALRDQEITLSDGTTAKLTEDQQVERLVPIAMRKLAEKSATPAEAFARQVEYLQLNNFVSKDLADLMESGAGAGVAAFATAEPGRSNVPPLPKTTEAGYELFKRLPPELRVTHTNERTALLYETAMFAEEYIDRGKPQDAILRAVQAVTGNAMTLIDEKKVRDTAASWTSGAANAGIVHGQIKRLASLLVNTNGGDEARAIVRASKIMQDRMVKVGTALVPIRNRTDIPQTLPHLSELVSEHWLKGQKDESGIDGSDLALLPTADPDLFILHDLRGLVPTPVDGWSETPGAAFTKSELRGLERVLSIDPQAEPRVYSAEEVRQYEARGATDRGKQLADLRRRAERVRFDRALRRQSLPLARRFAEDTRRALELADDQNRLGPSQD